jgi:UDP-N-acetylglucosamine--N-acetylmuramyl-(pentapeptide) pyrophosphoryl-undecaprenol N-acetylglucosamine transferase
LVVIAAGGTAGHVVPAIAVGKALAGRGVEVRFIGGRRAERELVPKAGFPFEEVPMGGLDRSSPLRAANGAVRSLVGVAASLRLLRQLAPAAVFCAGGYAGATVGLAAAALRLPLVIAEADSHLGLGNRLLAPFARRVCLAFPIPGREGGKYLRSGRPIPHAPPAKEDARRALRIPLEETYLVLFGGSLGARSLNEAALAVLPPLGVRVLHLAGLREGDRLAAADLPPTYRLERFLPPEELSLHLAAADLVICRAGGSVLEVAAHGTPMVVVPYPLAAADHQRANARYLVSHGAAVAVEDSDLPEGLARAVKELLADPNRLQQMGLAARQLSPPDGAQRIADQILEVAGWRDR